MAITVASIFKEDAIIPLQAFDVCSDCLAEVGLDRPHAQDVNPLGKLEDLCSHSMRSCYCFGLRADAIF